MYRFRTLRAALAVFVTVGLLVAHNGVGAAGEAFTGGSDKEGVIGNPVAIDDLSISGTGDDNITVNLYVDNGRLNMTTTTGLTGDTSGSDITFSGSRSDINTALATLTYRNNDIGEWTLDATIVSGDGEIFDPESGHVYEIVEDGDFINWNDANTAAESMSYGGADGYLATLTSEEENEYIAQRLNTSGWIGASDSSVEGDWRWVSGPEAGTSFWSGDENGSAVGGEYSNWNASEPNDSGSNEDCAEFRGSDSGGWNDLNCSTSTLRYYIVEYGDGETNPTIATSQIVITMSAPDFDSGDGSEGSPYVISDCEQLQALDYVEDTDDVYYQLGSDVDCSMTNPDDEDYDENGIWDTDYGFMPIGKSNDDFNGIFDGNGYDISGLFIDRDSTDEVGLFAKAENAGLTNISLVNADIRGGNSVGGVAGEIHFSDLSGSSVSGSVEGTEGVGGLVGYFESDEESANTIEDSSSTADVEGEGIVGGIVGFSAGSLDGVYATGDVYGGALVGGLLGATELLGADTVIDITDSYATSNVYDNGSDPDLGFFSGGFGGLAGFVLYVNISDSYAAGTVEAPDQAAVGGLLGAGTVSLTNTYASGDAIGDEIVGGIAGALYCENASIQQSFSTGAVYAEDDDAGGFAGSVDGCDISDSYSRSDVYTSGAGAGFISDLVESEDFATTITNSYASGEIEADQFGGFVGDNNEDESGENVVNSFWDEQLSGAEDSGGGTGKATSEMKNIATFTTDLGEGAWDFDGTWSIDSTVNSGYPCLQWADQSCETLHVERNDIEIDTCEELFSLTDENRYDNIELTQDIDCEGVEGYSMFSQARPFKGVFDGKYHTISNVVIDEGLSGSNVGIFSATEDATVKNVYLDDIQTTGYLDIGTIIGDVNDNTTLTNVHARNIDVTALYNDEDENGYIGGLVGDFDTYEGNPVTHSNLSATGTITVEGEADNVGGLFGQLETQSTSLTVNKVYSDVDIVSEDGGGDYGGLFGELEADAGDADASATVINAYAWGDITDEDNDVYNAGGLIGRVDNESDEGYEANIELSRVYARGDVEAYEFAGGLVGHFDGFDEGEYVVRDSFAMGGVDSEDDYGGILGDFDQDEDEPLTFVNVYYDQTGTGQEYCGKEDEDFEGCIAVNTDGSQNSYFINNNTRQPMANWDFSSVWVKNASTPPTFSPDDDNDGVSNTVENAGPNSGDANNDGTPDSEQANVASMVDPVSGEYAVLEVSEECSIESLDILAESEVSETNDADYDYPAGLMDFRLDCGEAGFTATITQYYYGVSGDFSVRKFKPSTGYFTIESASTSDRTIANSEVKVASYQVQDGGTLDLDGQVDGMIEDPAGLAQGSDLANTGSSRMLALAFVSLMIVGSFGALYMNKKLA